MTHPDFEILMANFYWKLLKRLPLEEEISLQWAEFQKAEEDLNRPIEFEEALRVYGVENFSSICV